MYILRFLLFITIICYNLFLNALQASPLPPSIGGNSDTVIIKFGESSYIQLHIANDGDRKVLSDLDLNALLDKVNAHMESKYKAQKLSLYSEAHANDGIRNSENQDITMIKTQFVTTNSKQSPEQTNPKEKVSYDKDDAKHQGLIWSVDVGISNYVQKGKSTNISAHKLQNWKSTYFAISANIKNKITSNTNFLIGVELSTHSFRFAKNTLLNVTKTGTHFVVDTFHVDKSKLNIHYLTLPLMFEFKSSKNWTFGLGGQLGYKIGSNTKRFYRMEGIHKVEKKYHDFGINNFKYGLRSQVGYAGVSLFMNYDLNSLFTKSSPDLQLFSFGLKM